MRLVRGMHHELLLANLAGDNDDDGTVVEFAEALAALHRMRYLRPRALDSAGRLLFAPEYDLVAHSIDFTEGFRLLFRTERHEFEALAEYLEAHSTDGDWNIHRATLGAAIQVASFASNWR
ncbi:hypothetical protein KEM55_005861 [Ascosphaera atra]|nr:hypothetical protein KEM55_005861 [Ascosphaera atra]